MRSLALVLFFSSAFLCVNCQSVDQNGTTETTDAGIVQKMDIITPAQYVEMAAADKELILIDLRTPEEIAQGHITGAKFINFSSSDFKSNLETLNKDSKYVIYCASGRRSHNAQGVMKEMGFTNVSDLQGGLRGWVAAGMPVVNE